MKKQFFAAAMILALGAGFTACSSDDLNVKEQKEVKSGKETMTYMTYTFSIPASGTRAATDTDEQGGTTPGFNRVAEYQGNDAIKKVAVYVFAGDNGAAKLEATQSLGATAFEYKNDENGKTVIKPKKGIQVTVGVKKVFLVVNPSDDAVNMLKDLKTLAEFEAAYNSDGLAFTGRTGTKANPSTDAAELQARPLAMDLAAGTTVKTAADVIATVGTGNEKSYIMMTGAPVTHNVSASIDEDATIADNAAAPNRFHFEVKRAVATVMISTKAASYNITGDDPSKDGLQNVTVATISNLTFSEAQGEQKLYFSQQAAPTADVAAGTAYQTPAYSFVPTTDAEYDNATTGAKGKYEYNGLWRTNTTYTNNTKGFVVPVRDKGILTSTDAQDYVAKNVHVPFLPATHKYVKAGGNYKKGNTAYVLVRGYITPTYVYKLKADKSGVELATGWNGTDVFYGEDGKFYDSNEAAQKAIAVKKGDANATQTVKFYKGRICLYTVWINPDTSDKAWKNAPTTRNNIYHVSINSITTLGESYNPLVPGDFPNPDPKPLPKESPNEGPNAHKPGENISPEQTWMSVDTEVVRWSIHSYGVDL